ncbi:UNVERIFIED_CONTAM: hypothetical protein GTU68_024645 [Idotea baltica]|nr:hypothetical protein [Idotea baltica]
MSLYSFFEKLVDPLPDEPVARPPLRPLRFIWHYVKPVQKIVLITLIISGIAALCEISLFVFIGYLVDWMNSTEPSEFWATHKWAIIGMILVAFVIRPVASIATRCLLNFTLSPGLVAATRWQNHRYVLRQSMNFFQNDFAGRVSQKVMQTGHSVREVVVNVLDGLWLLIIYVFGISFLLIGIKPILLIPLMIWLVSYSCVIIFMVPPVRLKSARVSEATSAITGRVVDSYTNIQSVKLFAHNALEENFAAEAIKKHFNAFIALMRAIMDMTIAMSVMNTALMFSTAALSVWLWMQGMVTVGEVAIANGLILRINQMSGWILRTITSLFEHIGTVENGIETICQSTSIVDDSTAPELDVSRGLVSFNNVSFNYDKEVPILDQCNLTIKAGEKIGLVGRSGAGKSTLINLLMRFHDIEHGNITIDNQDISHVTQESLRRNIAVVTQDTSLLHRSVRDNIRYGKADATDEQITQAALRAEAMQFIPDLVDLQGRAGLDATVGERGVKLSGGQRQRIAIARVILKDAPILILDEATSALDSEVESAIQEQLKNLMQNKTVLAVAHRLSTIAALDRLVVLDGGKIIETGSHTDLLKNNGLYAKLWERQSGGFLGA